MKKMLRISMAMVIVTLLLATNRVMAQPYPVYTNENFNDAWNTSTFPAGFVDSNLSHCFIPTTTNFYYRTAGHQLGGWALGPDSPATGTLHGYADLSPFDTTDGFLYSRADSAMGVGPQGLFQYDSFTVIDNWVFLPVDSISNTTELGFQTTTDPGLINNNYLDSLQVYYNIIDTSMDTSKFVPWPSLNQGPAFPQFWTHKYGQLNIILVPTPRIGRVAFRHHVKGNINGANSWFIAIDDIFFDTYPMPISLADINCKADKNNNVNVYWETESENNNDYFMVERSVDGKNFKQLGKVKAVGNSSTKHGYSFQDVTASTAGYNKVIYRVRQVDVNGKFGFSPIVEAMLTSTGVSNMVYPFMSGSTLSVRFVTGEAGNADIVVLNSNGQKVSEVKQDVTEGLNVVNQDFSSMAAGIYIVRVTCNKETLINRFVK